MPRPLYPSLSALRRAQVLPPDENDTERLRQLYATQHDKRVPIVDEGMDLMTGTIEGLMGQDFNNIKSLRTYRDTGRALGQAVTSPFPEIKALPMLGMTKFLNKEGLPDRLGRMIGTETFKLRMGKIGKLGMKEAGEEFAKRYPRIAAHINPEEMPQLNVTKGIRGAAWHGRPLGPENPEVLVSLNPNELDNLDEIRQTLSHEGTHVAQRLGMGDRFQPAYERAQRAVGYDMNPFEMSARHTANRYSLPEGRALAPVSVRGLTESMANMPKYKGIRDYVMSFLGY